MEMIKLTIIDIVMGKPVNWMSHLQYTSLDMYKLRSIQMYVNDSFMALDL